jgi:hypothetical protein
VARKAAVLAKRSASNAKKLGTFHLSVEAQISPQEVAPTADNALAQTTVVYARVYYSRVRL